MVSSDIGSSVAYINIAQPQPVVGVAIIRALLEFVQTRIVHDNAVSSIGTPTARSNSRNYRTSSGNNPVWRFASMTLSASYTYMRLG